MAFLKTDPEAMAKYRERKAESQRNRMHRLKANPETREMVLKRGREDQAKIRAKRNSTPESKEYWRQKANERHRKRHAERMSTDPAYAEKHRQRTREYFRNTENGRDLRRKTMARCYHGSIEFRLAHNMRKRIIAAIRGKRKFARSKELLGCTTEELKAYLAAKFQPGMNWDNFGRGDGCWSMDHKTPLASYDLSTEEGQRTAFHYTNLQPLWHVENVRKSSIYNNRRWRYADHMPAASISA